MKDILALAIYAVAALVIIAIGAWTWSLVIRALLKYLGS